MTRSQPIGGSNIRGIYPRVTEPVIISQVLNPQFWSPLLAWRCCLVSAWLRVQFRFCRSWRNSFYLRDLWDLKFQFCCRMGNQAVAYYLRVEEPFLHPEKWIGQRSQKNTRPRALILNLSSGRNRPSTFQEPTQPWPIHLHFLFSNKPPLPLLHCLQQNTGFPPLTLLYSTFWFALGITCHF